MIIIEDDLMTADVDSLIDQLPPALKMKNEIFWLGVQRTPVGWSVTYTENITSAVLMLYSTGPTPVLEPICTINTYLDTALRNMWYLLIKCGKIELDVSAVPSKNWAV